MGFGETIVDDYDGRGEARVTFRKQLTPSDPPDPSAYAEANMAFWNSVVDAHANSPDYALQRFRDDGGHLSDVVRFDQPRLGAIGGLRGIHLQCHIGTDTVSLARLGATMTGLDLSGPALHVAAGLARDAGVDVRFVEAHTYDALRVVEPESFDLVYTGIGALNWLPSIRTWAAVVAGLLAPGGRLFIREGHPMLGSLAEARPDRLLAVEHPYFETEGQAFGGVGTYAETDQDLGFAWTIEFNHGLAEIMTALIDEGLTITSFEEHDSIPWVALEGQMDPIGGGEYRLADRPERLPHSYTLQARKAESDPGR